MYFSELIIVAKRAAETSRARNQLHLVCASLFSCQFELSLPGWNPSKFYARGYTKWRNCDGQVRVLMRTEIVYLTSRQKRT